MKKIFVGMSAMAIASAMLSTASFADGLKTIKVDKVQTVGALEEQLGGRIEIKETAKDSWSNTVTFKITAPTGVRWNEKTTVNGVKPKISNDEITFSVDSKKDVQEMMNIIPYFDIDRKTAKGDLVLSVSSIGNGDTSEAITVAKITDYSVIFSTMEKKSPKNEKINVEFTLAESVENSVLPSSIYDLSIKNATIDKDSVKIEHIGGFDPLTVSKSDSSYLELKFTEKSDTKNKWKISMTITPDKNYTGDVMATFDGRGIDKVETVVANVYESVKVNERTPDNIDLGKKDQPIKNIYLIENIAGALKEGNYTLKTSPDYKGIMYSGAKVSTQDGNIYVDNTKSDDNMIHFTVKGASTKMSAIKISDIKLTLDRMAYDGIYKMTLVNDKNPEQTIAEFDLFNVNGQSPTVETAPTTTNNALNIKFIIGSKHYLVQESPMTLDVAPYIAKSRTMLPVRAVAEALTMDTKWNASTKTVTLTAKDGKEVVLVVGEKTMTIDGKTVSLDAPAEIMQSRTFLPLRSIAEAVGVKVDWDSATKTVTLTK